MIILKWGATTHEISRENNYHTRDQVPPTTPRTSGGGLIAREAHPPPQRQPYLNYGGRNTRQTEPYHYGNRGSSKAEPDDYHTGARKDVHDHGYYLAMAKLIQEENEARSMCQWPAPSSGYYESDHTRHGNCRQGKCQCHRMQEMARELSTEVSKADYFARRISNRAEVNRFLACERWAVGLFYASHGLTAITETELVWSLTVQDELQERFAVQAWVSALSAWEKEVRAQACRRDACTRATPDTPRDAPTTQANPAMLATPRNADAPARAQHRTYTEEDMAAVQECPARPSTITQQQAGPAAVSTELKQRASKPIPMHVSNYDREQHPGPHFTALASHIIDPWLPPPLAAA